MRDAVHEPTRRKEGTAALTITAIYLLFGGLWILFSDALLHALVADDALLLKLQTFKGWFFVAVTGLMLFTLIGRSTRAVRGAYEALRESQSLLQSILDNAPVSIFVKDLEGRYRLVNRSFQQRCNLERKEMLGRTDYDLVPPEQADAYRRHDREVIESNSPIEREDVVHLGGAAHTYIAVKFPLVDSAGLPYAVCGISTDITERKLAEERLLSERQLSDRIIDSLPGTFYIFDEGGRFVRWNRNLEALTGYSDEEIVRMSAQDFVASEDREVLARKVEETLTAGEATMEADLVARDGTRTPFFFSGTRLKIDGRLCVAGMGFDISKRKRAEASIADRERRLSLFYQNVADCLYMISVEPDGRFCFISVNDAFLTVTGFRKEQVVGRYIEEVLPAPSQELVKGKYREAIEGNKTVRWEEVAEMPAGRRIGEVFVTPVRDEVAGLLYLLGGVHDVTDRIAGEEALRESESKFRMLAESSASAILYHLDDGTFAYVNPAAERMTGYSREELMRLKIWDLLHPDFRKAVEARLLARQAGENVVSQNEVRMLVKGGETRWINYTAGRVLIDGKPAIIAMATDVTERRRAEEQLHASREQLRALSARLLSAREEERKRIAREIHDELGQSLTGLIIELSWLEDKLAVLPDGEHTRPLLTKTASMLRLADSTVESVRRIASELRPGLLDDFGLVAAIEWHAQEFEQRTGVRCQVSSGLDETILSPEHGTALFRIFQEALTNVARHAAATAVRVRLFREEGQVVLRVEDDGSGIAEDELSSARSLGVIGMRERASLLGGAVQITGTPGAGTTVVARVPVGGEHGEAEAA